MFYRGVSGRSPLRASNRLFHSGEEGHELSFPEAMMAYQQTITQEIDLSPPPSPPDINDPRDVQLYEDIVKDDKWMKHEAEKMRAAADMALQIYDKWMRNPDVSHDAIDSSAATEMIDSDDEHLKTIGKSLMMHDYSHLAI